MQNSDPSFKTLSDPRWADVIARSKSPTAHFFYAVRTTGIFCRPSCPSRRPKPENVEFFQDVEGAKAAGFRPCLRCDPEGSAPDVQLSDKLATLCRWIEDEPEFPSLEQMAAKFGASRFHFHRQFRAEIGMTPHEWAVEARARRMREALSAQNSQVTRAIYEAGYNSSSRFYDEAHRILGMTAVNYKSGGAGEPIIFAIGQSKLGAVLVARSERGICAITLGDDPQELVDDLHRRFPKARLTEAGEEFNSQLSEVIAFVEAPRIGLNLPLDIRGTAFQARVWRALREVPVGETISYSKLAEKIDSPKSARAVAKACASNALAVAIPCHRVVRSDGNPSGYRWGSARKINILRSEGD